MSAPPDLQSLLNPRSVAIVGATPDVRRPGGRPLPFLKFYGYEGAIYPVNPRHEAIDDVTCYPDVGSLPETADMAVISVPAKGVLQAVADCHEAGIRAMTIYTSGFAEMGGEGADMETELKALAAEAGSIVCGPNCQGVANFNDRMCAYFASTLGKQDMPPGALGFVSQSGLFGGMMAAECQARGLGLGYLVSTGNEAVLDFSDVLAYMVTDPRIRVAAGYLEGARDGDKLRRAAEIAREHGKPIVLIKVGRTEEGAKAAASHTGSMTGSYDVYRAAFAQWGIIEVDTIEELFDVVEAFALGAAPEKPIEGPGDRVGVLTNSGGIGVFTSDKTREVGLRLGELSPETSAAIKANLPEFGSPRNPVDITLQAFTDPDGVGDHIRHILADDGIDGALAFFGVQMLNIEELAAQLATNARDAGKPLVVGWGQGDPRGLDLLRQLRVPIYGDALRALRVLAALLQHGRSLGRAEAPIPVPGEAAEAAAGLLHATAAAGGGPVLSEHAAKAVLEAAGIPVTRSAVATSAEMVVEEAATIGYPVALKIESPDIQHKTEAGGVALGLGSADEVRSAFERVTRSAAAYAPDAGIEGVGVHEMVAHAVELIVGIKRDPVFGPVVLLGTGGVMVEVLRDAVLRIAPIGEAAAEAMVRELKSYPILAGARGRPKADIGALVEVLCKVSELAVAAEDLTELDINPLMVLREGESAKAADALIALDTAGAAASHN
ncbi:MAG: acetate--CoA ligase family protein [Alphaproteobacteria bacterium]|jgi:acetyltransferase|nr:acetate--CoA ligase family protein [Alphaproteobacteria bacterium]